MVSFKKISRKNGNCNQTIINVKSNYILFKKYVKCLKEVHFIITYNFLNKDSKFQVLHDI